MRLWPVITVGTKEDPGLILISAYIPELPYQLTYDSQVLGNIRGVDRLFEAVCSYSTAI